MSLQLFFCEVFRNNQTKLATNGKIVPIESNTARKNTRSGSKALSDSEQNITTKGTGI